MREGNSGIDLVKAITRLSFSVPLQLRLSLLVLFLSYLLKKNNKKNKPYGWVDTVWSLQQRSPLARLRHTEHTASERSSVGTAATLITRRVSSLFKKKRGKKKFLFSVLLPRFFIAGHLKFSLTPREEFWESETGGPTIWAVAACLAVVFTVVASVLGRRDAQLFETTKHVLFHTFIVLYFGF